MDGETASERGIEKGEAGDSGRGHDGGGEARTGLDALCVYLGVALEYEDAWGRRTVVPEAKKRDIVAALGYPVADQAEAEACLADLRAAARRRILPPLLVVQGGTPPLRLAANLPVEFIGRTLPWRIVLEDGGERSGVVVPRPASADTPLPDSASPDSASPDAPLPEADGSGDDSRRPALLELPIDVPPGHHRLRLFEPAQPPRELATAALAICPATCFQLPRPAPQCLGDRLWGPAVQVYALRSSRNWGIGDFGDLLRLVDLAADAGAHVVGVNPLHALFPHDPVRASPYSPSSREWLNVLYVEIETTRDYGECAAARGRVEEPVFQHRLDALRATEFVDYGGVAEAKFEVLEMLYRHFRTVHLERNTQRAGLFRDFQREGGRSLRAHALFDALQERFFRIDPAVWGWTVWPEAYRDIDAPAVEAFALANEERVEFFEYLQWQAEAQLRRVAARAQARGMAIGLYRDLAVGVNEGGSESWARPKLHALGIHAGAPPDELNPAGQDWGFPPVIPQRLAAECFEPFLAVLRANMRHAGALRIDHVMSLMRLFWLPGDGQRQVGAYVAYPMEELLGLLCLESRSHRCVVIGEDLGIVPQEVRDAMARHAILSYRPLYFEQDWDAGGFRAPRDWPAQAVAAVSTHDLPTLRSYWSGFDLQLRDRLGMYREPGMRDRQFERREADRCALLAALAAEKGSGDEPNEVLGTDPARVADDDPHLAVAVHRFIARTPAAIAVVQFEDVLGQLEGVNLPGTSESEYPNWRRKLGAALADIEVDPRWRAVSAAVDAERPCPLRELSGGPPDFHPETAAIPRATYRLQFHADFGFAAAEAVLPYLAELGISHVYAAPFLKARPGSRHGYDIIDHQAVNPEIGSEADFDRYCARLAELGLGQVLDVVPNHVGVLGADNEWWLDVLENGEASECADHFDIDWHPPFPELRGKVLLPVLGDQYGLVLEAGELTLGFSAERGEFSVHYFEHRFPVDPCDYPSILTPAASARGAQSVVDAEQVELETLLAALRHLPPRDVADPALQTERRHNKNLFKQHLAALHERLPAVRARIGERLAAFNGRVGEPASFDALDALLARQAYRLASWRVAADDINYRRFFDINDLAALRMEVDSVFEATHAQIFRWLAQGRVSGLRIDHPDGLAEPVAYFERLQARHAAICRELALAGGTPSAGPEPALYLVVEKILAEFEPLPADWPVHGDTGYRFANLCNGLFVDSAQESRFSRIYRAFTGEARNFSEVLHEAKLLIMTHSLPGEVSGLAGLLHDIAQHDRRTRDFTRSRLRGALKEIVAGFPVYRTYIGPRGVSDTDRRYIERAIATAAARTRAGDATVLRFVRDVLVSAPSETAAELRLLKLRFVRRFQQFTAPVMAKSMEDTAFYRYNRLVSLNDVGGDPHTFGIAVQDFHAANERVAASHPFGLVGSSTHDSKRSEDVRARIDVLSEMPGAWRLALRRWRKLNERHKRRVNDALAPSCNDEYLLYQTLLGVWPATPPESRGLAELARRVDAYMLKAAREAKRHTSWMNPEPGYEAALSGFVRRLFAGGLDNPFVADFLPFHARVSCFGCYNSLAMALLKLTAPGVPDIYQGCETWNYRLVDPDNRFPVDFAAARDLLHGLKQECPDGADEARRRSALATMLDAMSEGRDDGRIKLYVLWRALAVRREFEQTMRFGRYVALETDGPAALHVVAFARVLGDDIVVVVASRLLFTLCRGDAALLRDPTIWQDTFVELPAFSEGRQWRDALCGQGVRPQCAGNRCHLDVARLFGALPLALLVPQRMRAAGAREAE
ncbi:putative fusion of 4-alpha glucanotransferase and maltooligosyltrehalose synthase [Aromatoleum aromaticum EbN1]|uniref:4-alpha-glucanotransferase n=1 Tax=Aromatoleum aromaticum (strain DSM 19018 / LMG 30748 / EbN1) TaxID=76114 RepID=Q5NXZ6_AROAE|nr:malto-oligosyltrehalose synthase [Aromatoleum aromaticum]CAI10068.1 putative fusion of 4-alpha glucanotransferase and maltooligosyltrehalose synthase [Aromatoleum aromaticum EbN1]